ncbi:MAG: choline ABC transporter permease subunit, partial [Alphaproteobacteria bacterium]|nr:choline ABC transporter permease subunit [Alphaproteobacteria bacterium]
MEWITENKIPVGQWMKNFVDFLTDYFFWFFDYITIVLEGFTIAVAESLLWVNIYLLIAIFTVFAGWLHRSWKLALFTALGLLFIVNLGY